MSTNPPRPRPTTTDFRPRYPLDPYTVLTSSGIATPRPSIDLHDPWLLRFDPLASQGLRRDVVLVLGTPVDKSLHAFLLSPGLSTSLVIIVTHVPPPLTSSSAATVRILRLNTPLVVEDNGAVRLVSILEWAERIARIWRTHGANGADLLEFDEASMEDPACLPRMARSTPGSPLGSSTNLAKTSCSNYFGTASKHFSLLRKRTNSATSFRGSSSLPPVDPTQRPFDAIVNYVSEGVAEKQILKQTILVTSITRPYLASTLSPYDKISQLKENRKSMRKRRASLYSLPSTPPYHSGESLHPDSYSLAAISSITSSIIATPSPSAHMIHILPRSPRSILIQSLDSFLASFSVSDVSDDVDHAKQYIMHGSTLCAMVAHPQEHEQGDWTVADLILNGSFDDIRGKAWIGSEEDVLLLPPGGGTFSSLSQRSSHGSITDRQYSPVIEAQPSPSGEILSGKRSVRKPERTVVVLTPPPSPRSRVKSVPAKPDPPPSPVSAKPKRYTSNPSPHSEVSRGTGSANDIYNVPQKGRTSTLPRYSANKHRLSIPPMVSPKDVSCSNHSLPPGSSIPTLTVNGRDTSKVIRRSKLNMIIQLDENGLEGDSKRSDSLPTPPDSDDSGDSVTVEKGGDMVGHGVKKPRWRFWKTK